MIFIDTTRLHKRKNQNPSGIDRVIIAYKNWLQNNKKPLVELKYDFYGVSTASEPSRSLLQKVNSSTLQIEAKRIALKQKQFAKLYEADYKETKSLDISVDGNRWKISKLLAQKIDHSELSLFFSIGHDVLLRNSYLEWLSGINEMKKIFFIHDTIPLDYPEFCKEEERSRHKLRIFNAHIHGDLLIVNSQYTAERLEYWRKFWNLKSVPVHILHIGLDDKISNFSRQPRGPDHPYFVILGTIEPRKNHLLLLNVWKSIIETIPLDQIPKLLIIGRFGWEVEVIKRILERNTELTKVVEIHEDLKDTELIPILEKANALLFPSFVEGWGMPLVEALSLQVPAICSDIPSLREAGQDLAEYCSPLNGEQWKDKILEFTHYPEKSRAEQMKRLKSFKAPTWEKHFEKLETIIDQL